MLELNDVVRVVLTGAGPQTTVWQLVWHYIVTGGGGIDPVLALAAAVAAYGFAYANIQGDVADEWSWNEFDMLQWDFAASRWDGIANQTVPAVSGANVADTLPHGNAGMVRISTALPRRQGRSFLPGLTQNAEVDGLWTAAVLVNLLLYAADFDVPIAPAGGTMTWCTFNTDPLSVFFETASLAIQDVVANEIVAYQRRRKPLVGL